ncbi:unnamed protein product [Staurois parvus]|uniref:Uncharacterized protein n=1 Tax=Staurois parvus TaxID=386267 RepID=A0ABN9CN85_9NEOB|nr:unnamed protein product [Staurois parvus]
MASQYPDVQIIQPSNSRGYQPGDLY